MKLKRKKENKMVFLVVIAIISLILGVLFIAKQDSLERIQSALNKIIINTQALSNKNNKILGIFLVVFACFLFCVALRLK